MSMSVGVHYDELHTCRIALLELDVK
jgi:hypothetical protein